MATKNTKMKARNNHKATRRTNVRKVTKPATVEDLLISSVRSGLKAALKDHYLVEEIVDNCLTTILENKVVSASVQEVVQAELDLILADRDLVRAHLLDRLTKG
jgi:hypothetical protein